MAFGFANKISKVFKNWLPNYVEKDSAGNWYFYINDNANGRYHIESFSRDNAYILAKNVAEIFFPIDAIADRASGIPYIVVDANDKLIEKLPNNIANILNSRPNILSSFQSLIYDLIFAELSTGNSYLYAKIPDFYNNKNYSPENVTSLWSLEPDHVTLDIKSFRPDVFNATEISDIIDAYNYSLYESARLEPFNVAQERLLQSMGPGHGYKSDTPLWAAKHNINNLLATYAARYKIYINNGAAGILTRKPVSGDAVQQAVDPVTREDIIEDITARNGLTGDKRPWTVSAIPLDFIKTLATIKELEPFKETEADADQIAGIYGIDTILLPTGSDSTYTNKEIAERNLWQNVVMGKCNNVANQITEALHLAQFGWRLKPDFSAVEALQDDKKKSRESDAITIGNCKSLLESNLVEEKDIKTITDKIVERYKNDN